MATAHARRLTPICICGVSHDEGGGSTFWCTLAPDDSWGSALDLSLRQGRRWGKPSAILHAGVGRTIPSTRVLAAYTPPPSLSLCDKTTCTHAMPACMHALYYAVQVPIQVICTNEKNRAPHRVREALSNQNMYPKGVKANKLSAGGTLQPKHVSQRESRFMRGSQSSVDSRVSFYGRKPVIR